MTTLLSPALPRNPAEDAVPSYVLYSPQGSKPLAGLHVEGGSVSRYYDKGTRSQLLRVSPSAHVAFLRNTPSRTGSSSTGLVAASQRIVILQLFCEPSARATFSFTIELMLQDKMGRRRVLFSNSFHRLQQFAQHVKVPLACVTPGVWTNIVLDVPRIHATLYSGSAGRVSAAELIESRRLLSVTISCNSVCCVRRVLGMSQLPPSEAEMTAAAWPLSLRLPPDVQIHFWIIRTCDEEFLQNTAVALGGLGRTHDATNECAKSNLFTPAPARDARAQRSIGASGAHVVSVVPEGTAGGLGDVAGASGPSGGDQRDARKSAAQTRGDSAALCVRGHNGGEAPGTQREKGRAGKQEAGLAAALSSRNVSRRNASVQTNNLASEGIHVKGTKSFLMRDPVETRQLGDVRRVMVENDKKKEGGEHVVAREEQVQRTREKSRDNGNSRHGGEHYCEVPTAKGFETTHRPELSLEGKSRDMNGMRDVPQLEPAPNGVKSGAPTMWTPVTTDYHHALDVMRERVQRIRALISSGVEPEEYRNERGGVLPETICFEMSGSDSRNKNDHDSHRHVGEPKMHSVAEPHLTNCNNTVQRHGVVTSPRVVSSESWRMKESGHASLERTLTPEGRKHVSSDVKTQACLTTPDSGTDEDEEERFTVNVCMSGDCECPAFVVPAEPPVFDQKPPVPPSRFGSHKVDRLCFDSSLSEATLQVPSPRSSVCRSAIRVVNKAEGDLTPLPLSRPVEAATSAAVVSFQNQWQRPKPVPHRGRLGGDAAEVMAPVSGIPPRARMGSTTPQESVRLSCGDGESSVSAQDYRQPPMSGSTGRAEAARNNTRFMCLEGVGSVNEENDDAIGDEDVPPLPKVEVSCSQSLSRQREEEQPPQQWTLPPALSLSLLQSEKNTFTDDAFQHATNRKDVAVVESRGTSGVPLGSVPLSTASPTEFPDDLDGTRQPFSVRGALVFDPILQCCLDLGSNTYVMGTGCAQKNVV